MTEAKQSHAEQREPKEFAEESASLVKITAAPVIWATHFVVCYAAVAIACAKGLDYEATRLWLLILSAGVLAGIGFVGWRSWRQWAPRETGKLSHPKGRAEDRHHFLGHAAFLLSVISFIGALFTTLPLLFIGGCQ